MSNRFHNKFHSHNHHTKPTDRDGLYPDSAYDPIASREAPFKGEFYAEEDITAAGSLSARFQVTAQDGLFHRNVTIKGNLDVLGDVTQLDTFVQTTSAVSITNQGTGPALTVTQTGQTPIAHFIDAEGDDIIFDNSGFLGLGTINPNKKLTVIGDISAARHSDPLDYGFGHIFNDGNTTTQGRLTVFNETHLLSSAFISNNLRVHTNTFNVSSGGNGYGRVGINTTIPTEELTVVGDTYISEDATIGIDLDVLRDTRIARNLFVNTKGLVSLSGTDGNSKVGVNTLTPNVELTIKGSLSSTGDITSNGGLTADGNFYTKSSAKIDGQTTIGTVNPTTYPDTTVKVLVHDDDNVVRFNYPNDVIWDTTAEFLTARNLTSNTLPLYKSRFTLENSPISLDNSTINIAANLSANGNLTANGNFSNTGTIKSDGNLTAANVFGTVIYSDDSNSREWKSVYTTMRNTSATWEEAAAQAGSGGAFNTIKAVSGTWDETYTIVKANSASWNALADGVVFRTGSDMTGPLTINPQGENYSTTALSLTGDINLKGTIVIDTNAVAPVMSLSNPEAYGRLEVGGLSGGYIDFKSPFTDDFDIRVAHDQGTSYIATSGDLYVKTGNSLSALRDRAVFKANGKVGIRTSDPTAFIEVSASTAVYNSPNTNKVAKFGPVEIIASSIYINPTEPYQFYPAFSPHPAGVESTVKLDIGSSRDPETVGATELILGVDGRNGLASAIIRREPKWIDNYLGYPISVPDPTATIDGDLKFLNYGAGQLLIDQGGGADDGNVLITAGYSFIGAQGAGLDNKRVTSQGYLSGIDINRYGIVISNGFVGIRNEFVTVKGVSGAQIRLTNNNNPTATRPISSSISFRNGIDIPDAEILDERRSDGSSSLLFRTTAAGLSTTNRTTTVMAVANGRVGVNTTNPQSILDVNGSIRVPIGDPSSSSQTTIGYAFAGAGNTGLFGTTSQASIYTAGRQAILSQVTSGSLSISLGASEATFQNDSSGNVFIGTSQYGQGETKTSPSLYSTKRALVIRSSTGLSIGGGGGLIELADGIGGHSIVYRNSVGGSINNGGDLILDGRTANTGVKINTTGAGVFQLRTGVAYNLNSEGSSTGLLKLDVDQYKFEINDERVKFKGFGTQFQPLATSSPFGTYAGIEIRSEATSTNAPAGSHIDFTKTSSGTKVNTIRSVYSTTGTPSACLIFETSNGNNGNWKSMMAISSSGVNINTNSIYNQGYSLDVGGTIRATTLVVDTLSAANIAATSTVTPTYLKLQNIGSNPTKLDLVNLAFLNSINFYTTLHSTQNPFLTIQTEGGGQIRSHDTFSIYTGINANTPVGSPGRESIAAFTFTGETSAAKMGIGTGTPTRTIDVRTGKEPCVIRLQSNNDYEGIYFGNESTTNIETSFIGNMKMATPQHFGEGLQLIAGNSQDINFYTIPIGSSAFLPLSAATPRMTIKDLGNVGIGTVNPTATLEVSGSIKLEGNVEINSSGTNYGTLFVGRQDNALEGGQIALAESNYNSPYWYLDVYGASSPRFRIHKGATEVFSITNDGTIGIRKLPAAGITLDVDGSIRGTHVVASNTAGQAQLNYNNNCNVTMIGPRGALIDIQQTGGVAGSTADPNYSLRIKAYQNENEIDSSFRNLVIKSNSNATFNNPNESRITLGSGNKVGIGPAIVTPAATLHVGGDAIVASGGIRNNNTATELELYSGTTASKRAVLSLNGTGSLNTDGVTITTGSTITSLTINNSGRTALGTGGNALARLHIARSSTAASLNNHIYLDGTINGTSGWFIDTQEFGGGNVPFRISARIDGVNTNHFVITNGEGNVGIGLPQGTYPSTKLHVEGNTRFNGLMQVGRRNAVDEGGYIEIGRASDNQAAFAISVLGTGTSPRTRFITNVGGEVMTILNTSPANIGIRNTNPTEALDVSGNIKASGTVTAGSISTTGTFAAGSISTTGTITVNNIQLNGGNLTTTSQFLTINSSNGKINCIAIECAGEVLTKTINFTNVKETKQNKSVLGDASVSINLGEGSIFEVSSPSLNINSFTLSNLPTGSTSFTLIITQGSTPRTVNWLFVKDNLARTIKWPDGEVPVVTQTANKTDIFVFTTFDSGTTWFGGTVGQNY